MSSIDWKARFPELRPIESVPILWSVKGCGFLYYGRRDHDEESRSYVQTYGFCLLGIPVWNLGAYLFAEFPYGFDVVGRLPLSQPARTGNAALLTMILMMAVVLPVGLGLWALNRAMHNLLPNFDHRLMPDLARFSTIGKPGEFARQRLARADELAAAGKAAESARALPGGRPVARLSTRPGRGGGSTRQDDARSSRGGGASGRLRGRRRAPASGPMVRSAPGAVPPGHRGSEPAGLGRPGRRRSRSSRPSHRWPRRART